MPVFVREEAPCTGMGRYGDSNRSARHFDEVAAINERCDLQQSSSERLHKALQETTLGSAPRLVTFRRGTNAYPKKSPMSFDSFEKPKIDTVNFRVTDEQGIDYDIYGGEPHGCPPIPRVGESVRYYLGRGFVTSVEHSFEEYNNENRHNITVQLGSDSVA